MSIAPDVAARPSTASIPAQRSVPLVRTPVRTFRFIDLFAGIGGFHLAMEALGGECVFASEIDRAAADTYESNHGMRPEGDIREFTGSHLTDAQVDSRIPDHDVLCAGFPCQAFSKAGARLGLADTTRGTLFYEIARILEVKRPRFIVLENVKNLAGHDGGNTWKIIVERLHELGYRVNSTPVILSPHLLSEEDGGAPQNRERVFILGEHQDYAVARGEEAGLDWDFYPTRATDGWDPHSWDLRKWLADHPAAEPDLSPYALTSAEVQALEAWGDFAANLSNTNKYGFPVWEKQMVKDAEVVGLPGWKQEFHRKNAALYNLNRSFVDRWRRRHDLASLSDSKRKFEWQAGTSPKTPEGIFDMLIQFRPSGVRVKKPSYVGALVAITQTPVIGWERRHMTPTEAASLQGLPTKFKLHPNQSAAFKQLGNGVNVGVVKHATEALFARCKF